MNSSHLFIKKSMCIYWARYYCVVHNPSTPPSKSSEKCRWNPWHEDTHLFLVHPIGYSSV